MIELKAPAKLNIYLYVGRKRKDGYHPVHSLIVPITLVDKIYIETDNSLCDDTVEFENIKEISKSDNTVIRAIHFLRDMGIDFPPLKIRVKKYIPAESGLGGASSDAAEVIKWVLKYAGKKIDDIDLMSLVYSVGSDVPFFLYNTPSIVSGIGDRVRPIEVETRPYFLIGIPPLSVSTKDAYELLDRRDVAGLTRKQPYVKDSINFYRFLSSLGTGMHNDFWQVLKRVSPIFERFLNALIDEGAIYASLSGSGSAVFGIFKEEGLINSAILKLKNAFCDFKFYAVKIFSGVSSKGRTQGFGPCNGGSNPPAPAGE